MCEAAGDSAGPALGLTPGVPLQTEVLSQIDFPYALIINDFLGLAVGEHRAIVDDISPVADTERLPHIMVGDQHADAPRSQKPDDFLDFQHRDRIDSGKWLVEQDEAGLGGERASDFDAAALAARQADRGVIAQMGDVQIAQEVVELQLERCSRPLSCSSSTARTLSATERRRKIDASCGR